MGYNVYPLRNLSAVSSSAVTEAKFSKGIGDFIQCDRSVPHISDWRGCVL